MILFHVDTEATGLKEFTPQNISELKAYKIEKCGGTDFMAIWNYLRKHGIVPERLVVFTDGEPYGSWGEPNYCDTLFIVHTTVKAAPFGMTVPYIPRTNKREN